MATTTEQSVEERLKALYELQLIDSELHEIEILKGELPIEVSDLEDELAGLEKRTEKLNDQIQEIQEFISSQNARIKEAEEDIKRFNAQMDEVKNNREYEALTKQIENQGLDIKIYEKHIREAQIKIDTKKETLEEVNGKIATRREDLENKKKELKDIIGNTEKQEKELIKIRDTRRAAVPERLLKTYDRVRTAYRNGIAIATVERDACGGCFNRIPSQKQIEIAMHKRIIACEHCGRVLVDEQLMAETE